MVGHRRLTDEQFTKLSEVMDARDAAQRELAEAQLAFAAADRAADKVLGELRRVHGLGLDEGINVYSGEIAAAQPHAGQG